MGSEKWEICRIRKYSGLSCHSCKFSNRCSEYEKKRKSPKKLRNNAPWNAEEISICADTDRTSSEVAEIINRTTDAVKHYRSQHQIYKRKEKNNETK